MQHTNNHFKVYDSGAFSAFTVLCTYHISPVSKFFHHPRRHPTGSSFLDVIAYLC